MFQFKIEIIVYYTNREHIVDHDSATNLVSTIIYC